MKHVEINGNLYYLGDCIEGCRKHVGDNSIDLIITDPPFAIEGDKLHKHYNRKEEFVIDGYIEVPASEYQDFSIAWINEAERILRPGGLMYIVSGYSHLYEIQHALKQTKLTEINHIIWKYNFGVYTRKKYISSHYHILYYAKPPLQKVTFNLGSRYGVDEKGNDKSSLNYTDREDVWIINREYKPGVIKNKNELPSQLLIKMLQYSSNEGDLVCDLFMGGFTTAKACIGLNRRFVGFELSQVAFDHQINEIPKVSPNHLLDKIRVPLDDLFKNRGQSWTEDEVVSVKSDFESLIAQGKTKQFSIEVLCGKYGRGRWAIERVLKR